MTNSCACFAWLAILSTAHAQTLYLAPSDDALEAGSYGNEPGPVVYKIDGSVLDGVWAVRQGHGTPELRASSEPLQAKNGDLPAQHVSLEEDGFQEVGPGGVGRHQVRLGHVAQKLGA